MSLVFSQKLDEEEDEEEALVLANLRR